MDRYSSAGISINKQRAYFSGGSSNTVALPILLVSEVRGLSSRSLWSRPAKEAGVRGMSIPSSIPIGSIEWPPMAPMPLLSRVPGTDRAMDLNLCIYLLEAVFRGSDCIDSYFNALIALRSLIAL